MCSTPCSSRCGRSPQKKNENYHCEQSWATPVNQLCLSCDAAVSRQAMKPQQQCNSTWVNIRSSTNPGTGRYSRVSSQACCCQVAVECATNPCWPWWHLSSGQLRVAAVLPSVCEQHRKHRSTCCDHMHHLWSDAHNTTSPQCQPVQPSPAAAQ